MPGRPSRLVSGQSAGSGRPGCRCGPTIRTATPICWARLRDALRTIRQPALALGGPVPLVAELARQVRRSVAAFRLVHPELVDLSPPERDELATRLGPTPVPATGRITLPGSLPVEFLSRDDYYRPQAEPGADWPRRSALPHRPGSVCSPAPPRAAILVRSGSQRAETVQDLWRRGAGGRGGSAGQREGVAGGAGAGAEAAEHPGVGEADGTGGRLHRGAVPDQVLGPLHPQQSAGSAAGSARWPARTAGSACAR